MYTIELSLVLFVCFLFLRNIPTDFRNTPVCTPVGCLLPLSWRMRNDPEQVKKKTHTFYWCYRDWVDFFE